MLIQNALDIELLHSIPAQLQIKTICEGGLGGRNEGMVPVICKLYMSAIQNNANF